MKKLRYLIMAALCVAAAACSKGRDCEVPSFLHVDSIVVYEPSEGGLGMSEGFYSSDITAAYVSVHYPGLTTLDTIGLFELPFTVPVLHEGLADYIHIYPAIAQSGVSATLPYYPALAMITLHDQTFATEDTLDLGTLQTYYQISRSDVLFYLPFEPDEHLNIPMSNIEWRKDYPTEARSGSGYGRVRVEPSQTTVDFGIDSTFEVYDKGLNIYLEMDIKSDVDVQLYMYARETNGGAFYNKPVMVVYKSDEWRHLYINLGRTWRSFNLYPTFQLNFKGLNMEGNEGYINIDNLKLLTFYS